MKLKVVGILKGNKMPKTSMKVKSGKKYDVKYKVAGSLSELSREAVDTLALRYLRTAARNEVQSQLNEAEPSIVANQTIKNNMLKAGFDPAEVDKFFEITPDMILEVPSEFVIPIGELIPEAPKEGEKARGKKAADLFSFEDEEEEESTEA